jgi:ribosomal protein L37E
MTLKRDPHDYCPKCDRRFGVTEESCSGCGFNPVNNAEDEAFYDQCVEEWRNRDK